MSRKFDELKSGCMARAFDYEPTFVLLARDKVAPEVIREWCRLRCLHGKNRPQDEQIREALDLADLMETEQETWHKESRQAHGIRRVEG